VPRKPCGITNRGRSRLHGSLAPGPAHDDASLQQGQADRLGIDLEVLADRGTGASRGVRRNRSFDVARGEHPPSSGDLVAFEKRQDSGPVNRVLAGQGERRRSCQVASDELLDFLGWEPALNLPRALRRNTKAPSSCVVSRLTDDVFVELADGCSDPRIDQIRPCDTALIRHFPW